MNENNTHKRPQRSPAARVALIVGGAVAGLLAVGLLGLGALSLYGEDQKDAQGYLNTDSHRFEASTHALATENLDLDLDGVEDLVGSTDLGNIRLEVAPESGQPIFVGIARTDEVDSYLRDVSHTTLTDLEVEPFEASYSPQGGERKPAPPAGERIWAASTQGAGSQTLSWDVEDGDWSVVVMNADGSRGVEADVSAGAKVPYLTEIGWSVLGGGALLLTVAAFLIVLGGRPPRNRPGRNAPAGNPAPSAG